MIGEEIEKQEDRCPKHDLVSNAFRESMRRSGFRCRDANTLGYLGSFLVVRHDCMSNGKVGGCEHEVSYVRAKEWSTHRSA